MLHHLSQEEQNKMRTMTTTRADGDKLKELRAARQLKVPFIEQATGIPPGRLTQYENNRSDIRLDYLSNLAEFYVVDPKEIVEDEGLTMMKDLAQLLANLLGAELVFKPKLA